MSFFERIVQIDATKSEWDDDDDDDETEKQTVISSRNSSSINENSYPTKRSSNLKKSSSHSSTSRKSNKSVSFDIVDRNKKPIPIFQQFTKETSSSNLWFVDFISILFRKSFR